MRNQSISRRSAGPMNHFEEHSACGLDSRLATGHSRSRQAWVAVLLVACCFSVTGQRWWQRCYGRNLRHREETGKKNLMGAPSELADGDEISRWHHCEDWVFNKPGVENQLCSMERLGHEQITMVTLEEPSSLLQCADHSGRSGMQVHPRLFLRA